MQEKLCLDTVTATMCWTSRVLHRFQFVLPYLAIRHTAYSSWAGLHLLKLMFRVQPCVCIVLHVHHRASCGVTDGMQNFHTAGSFGSSELPDRLIRLHEDMTLLPWLGTK